MRRAVPGYMESSFFATKQCRIRSPILLHRKYFRSAGVQEGLSWSFLRTEHLIVRQKCPAVD